MPPLQFIFFILLFTTFICFVSVIVDFGSFAVVGCKDFWNNWNDMLYSRDMPGTTLALRFPENNCTS